jgi:hypothetical protein
LEISTVNDLIRKSIFQGAHRLERGRRYFEIAEAEALRLGTPFNWQLTTVPNVGHEGGLMAAAAAPHLFSLPVD